METLSLYANSFLKKSENVYSSGNMQISAPSDQQQKIRNFFG